MGKWIMLAVCSSLPSSSRWFFAKNSLYAPCKGEKRDGLELEEVLSLFTVADLF